MLHLRINVVQLANHSKRISWHTGLLCLYWSHHLVASLWVTLHKAFESLEKNKLSQKFIKLRPLIIWTTPNMIQFRNICETMVCTKGESNSVEMKTYLTNTCKPLGKFTQYSVHTFCLVCWCYWHTGWFTITVTCQAQNNFWVSTRVSTTTQMSVIGFMVAQCRFLVFLYIGVYWFIH